MMKIRDEVSKDVVFQDRVSSAMDIWTEIRNNGLDILTWWELVVKPGLRNLALVRSREMKKDQRGELNMLLIKQAYLVNKQKSGHLDVTRLSQLIIVQSMIRDWYCGT